MRSTQLKHIKLFTCACQDIDPISSKKMSKISNLCCRKRCLAKAECFDWEINTYARVKYYKDLDLMGAYTLFFIDGTPFWLIEKRLKFQEENYEIIKLLPLFLPVGWVVKAAVWVQGLAVSCHILQLQTSTSFELPFAENYRAPQLFSWDLGFSTRHSYTCWKRSYKIESWCYGECQWHLQREGSSTDISRFHPLSEFLIVLQYSGSFETPLHPSCFIRFLNRYIMMPAWGDNHQTVSQFDTLASSQTPERRRIRVSVGKQVCQWVETQ